ncbi:unannotated protein [freshwater metagenome]|uniref:Unannotated protein n=1 Tax=freshwater metagenome TaxID=449393 RepID=A0A6J6CKM2_9ZZZZ
MFGKIVRFTVIFPLHSLNNSIAAELRLGLGPQLTRQRDQKSDLAPYPTQITISYLYTATMPVRTSIRV